MCNSLLIASDYKSLYLIGKRDEDRLYINGNGILLSVLGNGITGCEVPAQLRTHTSDLVRGKKPFFEMDVTNTKSNHVSVSYSDENSAVFVIGITDFDGSLTINEPTTIENQKIQATAVKLKETNIAGLVSQKVIFIKTEILTRSEDTSNEAANRASSSVKKLKFYLLDADGTSSS